MMMDQPENIAIKRYLDFLSNLTPVSLARLDEVVHPSIVFSDPFHTIHGIEAMRGVYRTMFKRFVVRYFEVVRMARAGDDAWLIRWKLGVTGLNDNRDLDIEGMADIGLAGDGKVNRHEDFWDSMSGLYVHIPVLGKALRLLHQQAANMQK
ncbi:MAG: nuclear transport factor 2 family protein [Alphaproteobacteria bacterium]